MVQRSPKYAKLVALREAMEDDVTESRKTRARKSAKQPAKKTRSDFIAFREMVEDSITESGKTKTRKRKKQGGGDSRQAKVKPPTLPLQDDVWLIDPKQRERFLRLRTEIQNHLSTVPLPVVDVLVFLALGNTVLAAQMIRTNNLASYMAANLDDYRFLPMVTAPIMQQLEKMLGYVPDQQQDKKRIAPRRPEQDFTPD